MEAPGRNPNRKVHETQEFYNETNLNWTMSSDGIQT